MSDTVEPDAIVQSVSDLLNHIREFKKDEQHHAHKRFWFRGQGDKDWSLRPGVYRPEFPAKTEQERLGMERHLNQDFRVQSATLMKDATFAELYFLQQHYRMPTRLLDWTLNPIAALFFAVQNSRMTSEGERDAAVFMMDAYRLAICQNVTNKFNGIPTGLHPEFTKGLRPITHWDDLSQFPDFIIPVRPEQMDVRLVLQRGCFTFHVPRRSELTPKENDSLRCLVIPHAAKGTIRQELSDLGVDDFSIYGDLENLARSLKQSYGVTAK